MLTKREREIACAVLWRYAHWNDGVLYVGTTGEKYVDVSYDIFDGRLDDEIEAFIAGGDVADRYIATQLDDQESI